MWKSLWLTRSDGGSLRAAAAHILGKGLVRFKGACKRHRQLEIPNAVGTLDRLSVDGGVMEHVYHLLSHLEWVPTVNEHTNLSFNIQIAHDMQMPCKVLKKRNVVTGRNAQITDDAGLVKRRVRGALARN